MASKGDRKSQRQNSTRSKGGESKKTPPQQKMHVVAEGNQNSGNGIQINAPTQYNSNNTTSLTLNKSSVVIEAIHYHARYTADVAHDIKRYAAVVKEVDIQVYGIARQAELTSATIGQLENMFKDFAKRKGKLPRRAPLPKVEALYTMIQKTASLLEAINELIYRKVEAAVIPQNEVDECPKKRELSSDQLIYLKREITIAQADIQLYTSNLDIQVTLFFGELRDQSIEELRNMIVYSISRMRSMGEVPSESKIYGRYLAGFHPSYTGWEISRTERATELAEKRPRLPGSDYSWDSPAVQAHHSDEDLFLHALQLRAQYVKQGKTLKTLQNSLTPDQRDAIETLRVKQNRLLEEDTIDLEWHLAGIDLITPLVQSSYPLKSEPLSLFIILKTGWRRPEEPAVLEPINDTEAASAFQGADGEHVVNARPDETNATDEHAPRPPRAQSRARAIPLHAPIIFVDSVADAMLISGNTPAPTGRQRANHTSRKARRQPREHDFQTQYFETRHTGYQMLGRNLLENYTKMSERAQNQHIDSLIREWDQVIECLPPDRLQKRKASRKKTAVGKACFSSWRQPTNEMMLGRKHLRLAMQAFIAPDLFTISRGPNSSNLISLKLKK